MARTSKSDLDLARERLARAERKLDQMLKANTGSARDVEAYAEPEARARADVAEARHEFALAEHAARVTDAEANALRTWLRSEVERARDAYAAIVVPSSPLLAGHTVEAVADYAAATVAHVEASETASKAHSAARVRVHAALDAVYKARASLVAERTRASGIMPAPVVPPAPLGSLTGLPYVVPQSVRECVALLEALDAAGPAPDVARHQHDAEEHLVSAERIKIDRERAARRAALSEDRQRFESQWGEGTAAE